MFNRAHICRLIFCAIITFLMLGGVSAFAQPVRIAVGAASISSLPTWVAQDSGFFTREGVPAELIFIRGGPQTMSALISGEVPFAQIYGGAVIAAALTGADVVIVAGIVNSPFFSIVTTKGIDKPEDLRGKKIGISTFGSATDFALRVVQREVKGRAVGSSAGDDCRHCPSACHRATTVLDPCDLLQCGGRWALLLRSSAVQTRQAKPSSL